MSDIGYVWVEWPYARIRRELETERGSVSRFVYQLEYDLEATEDGLPPHDWRQVARFDHDVDGHHDVAVEGLHLDIYRDGEKHQRKWGFGTVPVNNAPAFCEAFLLRNADRLLDRFEDWHDIGDEWR